MILHCLLAQKKWKLKNGQSCRLCPTLGNFLSEQTREILLIYSFIRILLYLTKYSFRTTPFIEFCDFLMIKFVKLTSKNSPHIRKFWISFSLFMPRHLKYRICFPNVVSPIRGTKSFRLFVSRGHIPTIDIGTWEKQHRRRLETKVLIRFPVGISPIVPLDRSGWATVRRS